MRQFKLRWIVPITALVAMLFFATHAFAARPTTQELLKQLGGYTCPGSTFTCVNLLVPLDHFNPSDGRTLNVVFAIHPATGTRKGMFVTATGGPGTSGIQLANPYSDYYEQPLFEHFDLIFFDQRGMGLSSGLVCPQAAATYYYVDVRADTPAHEQKLKTSSDKFANDCDAESGHSDLLQYLSTAQAVEDLDQFRATIGDDKIWLYGESYATQYAQQYAHVHADHLAAMILDGTVDLTLDGVTYFARATQSFNDTLVASLQECKARSKCIADYGRDPVKVYDNLAAQLKQNKLTTQFPLSNGKRTTRPFTLGNLDYAAIANMYNQGGRMEFTRALAAYARDGDLVPLQRLLYSDLLVDDTTFKPNPDPSYSDAAYYAVECQDYGYYQGTGDQRANQYIHDAKPVEDSGVRLSTLMWGDLPCVYWRDSSQDTTRPGYEAAPGVPTMVLNALKDPITPIASARAVYSHLDDAYLLTQKGGPHVLFGRGVYCIDDKVTAFLVDGTRPATRELQCDGKVARHYVPLAPADASSFASPLDAFQSTETEINYLPEYEGWDFVKPLQIGCPHTGTLLFQPNGAQVKFTLKNCSFSKGWTMTGTGYYASDQDRFWLQVNVTGEQTCQLTYNRTGATASIKGSCNQANVAAQSPAKTYNIKPFLQRATPLRPKGSVALPH